MKGATIDLPVERIIAFLQNCGDADIQAGMGYLLGIAPAEKLAAFRRGLEHAIEAGGGESEEQEAPGA